MNVELAEKAVRAAKAHPDRFEMGDWVTGLYDIQLVKTSLEFEPPCGTTACYAGWVTFLGAPLDAVIKGQRVYLPGRSSTGEHVADYAREVLGITLAQSSGLFYLNSIEQVERAVRYLADNPDASYQSVLSAALSAE